MRVSVSAVFCALACVALSSCSRAGRSAESSDSKLPSALVAEVKREDLTTTIELAAEFRPFEEVEVFAKVSGYIKKSDVDIGDRVTRGQLLATLEVPEMADDLALAEATQRRSEAETMRARSEIQRAESDHQAAHFMYTRLAEVLKTRPNLVAQQELDAAQSRDRVSEAQIGTARAALAAAEQQVQAAEASKQRVKTLIGYARITAPFAGVITRRNANTGAMIQAGTASQTQAMPVVRLSADDRLRLALPVPESAVPSVRIGAPVEVAVSALQRSFVGTVARFSGRMQSSTRTMETEIDVLNPRRVLIPGMFATVKMIVGQRKGALTVPVQAVADHEKRPSVLVVTPDGKVEERAVTLGVETAERIEIVTGVSAGEWVVIGGRNQLRPGQSVHPQHAEEGR